MGGAPKDRPAGTKGKSPMIWGLGHAVTFLSCSQEDSRHDVVWTQQLHKDTHICHDPLKDDDTHLCLSTQRIPLTPLRSAEKIQRVTEEFPFQ